MLVSRGVGGGDLEKTLVFSWVCFASSVFSTIPHAPCNQCRMFLYNFHPVPWGKGSNLRIIFFKCSWFNHQLHLLCKN